jgi:hypothetical protein
MKINQTFVALFLGLIGINPTVNCQGYTEDFNDVNTLVGSGWYQQNNSTPIGTNPNWIQGVNVAGGGPFDAFNGAANAYVCANFNSVAGANTISNWLVTPNRTYKNGDVFTFYTRKASPDTYPDRLEVRLSTNGASTNVGTGATGVGDFTTLLLSVNPTLVTGVYPVVWTQFTVTISGLPAPTSGRIAFRYFVTNGGPLGANSDYIGIDNVVYTPYVCPTFTLTPAGNLAGAVAGTAYSTTLTQSGALGTPSFNVTSGALPNGLTLSTSGVISGTPTATGTFNFSVTVSDASGCTGTSSYSITSVCPSNPITNSGLPTLCSNAAPITLSQFSPAGGTYSGTGVTGGQFDPSVGSQNITYDYTDSYGCSFSSIGTILVNTAPVVTLGSQATLCSNDNLYTINGESPAGGTFSGVGVSSNTFDPASGTQVVTYSYTDGNNCSNSATQTITVNTAPTVAHDPIQDICANAGLTAISGGSPVGGTYTGTGISGTDFDPSAGNQNLIYSYTDANGCSGSTSVSITVIPSETATLSAFNAVCDNAGIIPLTQGSPAGGIYSGVGVSGDNFDPASGTQTITYTIGSGTQCESQAQAVFNVFTSPVVSLSLPTETTCVNYDPFNLTGGSPAPGDYSGTGVNAGSFSPAVAGVGTITITYYYEDQNGCANIATDNIVVDACASIEEVVNQFSVSPNPFNSIVSLTATSPVQMENFYVFNIAGEQLHVQMSQENEWKIAVDFSGHANGVYVLKYVSDNTTYITRVVKN